MTNNINNINGYGFGNNVYGYGANARKENAENAEQQAEAQVQPEAKPQVKADDVMKFLEANNFFVAPQVAQNAEGVGEVDPAMVGRIEDAMAQFEVIYAVIVEEFGEEIAPQVMDLVMDRFMGVDA